MSTKLFKTFLLLGFSGVSNLFGQDISINILNQPPIVALGSTNGRIQVDICNESGGSTNLAIGKARPLLSLPPNASNAVLITPNSDWQVLINDGENITVTNTTTIAPGTCTQYFIGYTGAVISQSFQTVTASMGWNGPQTVGNLTGNDNSTTSITVRDAAAPVVLSNFSVDEFTNGNLLNWKTKDESGFSHFIVLKSLNLNEFWELGNVAGGTKSGKYDFLDTNFHEGINYYQLKMIDLNGSYKMSPIVSVENRGEFGSSTVYPNPSPNRVFKLKNSEEFDEINLMTYEGVKLKVEVRKTNGIYEVKVPEAYSAGTYFLQFINNSRIIRRRVVLL